MKRSKEARNYGLILLGRGLAASCHVGQLKAFCDLGLNKYLVYAQGNSSGGFNGAAISEAQEPEEVPALVSRLGAGWKKVEAQGPDIVFGLGTLKERFAGMNVNEFLEHWMKNMLLFAWKERGHLSEMITKIKETLYGESFLDGRRLNQFVEDYNPELALTSPMRFEVPVFNRCKAEIETFSVHDFKDNPEHFSRVLVASASLRPFFPAVKVGKCYYWDARTFDETSPYLRECGKVFVLCTYPKGHKPVRQTEWLLNSFGLPRVVGDEIFEHDVHCAQLEAKKIDALKLALGETRVICLYTQIPKTYGSLFFEKGDITKAMQMAEKSAREVLENSDL